MHDKKIAELSQSNQVNNSTGLCYSITTCCHPLYIQCILESKKKKRWSTVNKIATTTKMNKNIRLPFCYALIAISAAIQFIRLHIQREKERVWEREFVQPSVRMLTQTAQRAHTHTPNHPYAMPRKRVFFSLVSHLPYLLYTYTIEFFRFIMVYSAKSGMRMWRHSCYLFSAI